MEPHDIFEEGASNGLHGVEEAQGDEMCILGEAIDDGEDDQLPTNARKALNRVHGAIAPHMLRHGQRLLEAG
jgi:hypothetical protein